MNGKTRSITILIAEDDPDDRMLISEAFHESKWNNTIHYVENGEELMQYLNRSGKYASEKEYPFPELILLDLNMPKKDGREVLRELKTDEQFKYIPVNVLTTSKSDEDVHQAYQLGVNSYISKPVDFNDLVQLFDVLGEYWQHTAVLPKISNRIRKAMFDL